MARLLVDMNLSTEWIPLLKAAGHDAVHWSDVGDPRAHDNELMVWAQARGYAVFTHDLDFEPCSPSPEPMAPVFCRCVA